ncbi:hypothetical protein J132_03616 [Termitomyces sp. J132]|nr:hypothetical protein J132_03616 [Termitomyces sp. J132]
MAVLESNDQLGQLWALIQELSEQLNQNRSVSVSLLAQAGNIKASPAETQSITLFNLDKSQEEYDAELERMNTSMVAENQALQRDNKELNTLIKDYEQTLETLMSSFRNRAKDVQERELSLIREYETKILARQDDYVTQDLASAVTFSQSLARISRLLRQFLRSLNGEDLDLPIPRQNGEDHRESWTTTAASEYALERETELTRLEIENEELRRMLGLAAAPTTRPNISETRPTFEPLQRDDEGMNTQNPESTSTIVGPFGTYKRLRPQV